MINLFKQLFNTKMQHSKIWALNNFWMHFDWICGASLSSFTTVWLLCLCVFLNHPGHTHRSKSNQTCSSVVLFFTCKSCEIKSSAKWISINEFGSDWHTNINRWVAWGEWWCVIVGYWSLDVLQAKGESLGGRHHDLKPSLIVIASVCLALMSLWIIPF